MEDELYNEEKAYDEKISPLMRKIIEICNEHKIPMIASFTYENSEEDGQGRCTTHLRYDGRDDISNHKANAAIINPTSQFVAMAITSS